MTSAPYEKLHFYLLAWGATLFSALPKVFGRNLAQANETRR